MVTIEKSDIELVEGVKLGKIEDFEELLQRYTSKVLNLALRITRSHEDAEEVLQDVFITIHRKVQSFEKKSAFSSWLYRVTLNTAFMKIRARNRRKAISLEDIDPHVRMNWVSKRSDAADTDFIQTRHEVREAIEAAVEALPRDYRAIFILRDVDGLSNQAVSEVLQLSVPAIKSRLHRSRVMLREKLQGYLSDVAVPVHA